MPRNFKQHERINKGNWNFESGNIRQAEHLSFEFLMSGLLTLASSQKLLTHNSDEGWSEFDCTWHFCKKSSKVQHDKIFRSVRRTGLELYYNIRDKQCVAYENCGLRELPPQLRLVKLETETMLFACCSQQNKLSLD